MQARKINLFLPQTDEAQLPSTGRLHPEPTRNIGEQGACKVKCTTGKAALLLLHSNPSFFVAFGRS